MVSLYYPARPGRPGSVAPYMSTGEARLVLAGIGLEGTVQPSALSSLGTHARTGARTAHGRFPLVLLSPGFGNPRATMTSLAEDLASRGYVVASVDHAYESIGTELPDGRLLTCVACEKMASAPKEAREELGRLVSTGRATDLSFVLDRLTGHRPAWKNSRMIHPDRVAVAGHSIGGSAAASAMLADPRFDAGINMDGAFQERVPASGLGERPFMMLGTAVHSPGGQEDKTWDEGWPHLDGWKRWLVVKGAGHSSFTDVPVLEDRMGVTLDLSVTLTTDREVSITRDYVGAFLDQHLRGRHQPLLDGPTPGNPEVVFQRP